jgi:hypothetical protein
MFVMAYDPPEAGSQNGNLRPLQALYAGIIGRKKFVHFRRPLKIGKANVRMLTASVSIRKKLVHFRNSGPKKKLPVEVLNEGPACVLAFVLRCNKSFQNYNSNSARFYAL